MKRTLLALLLSVAMLATTILTAFPVVFAVEGTATTSEETEYGVFKGTRMDLNFDSDSDFTTSVDPAAATIERTADGTLKITTSTKTNGTGSNAPYGVTINVPNTATPNNQIVTISLRVRTSTANDPIVQISSNFKSGATAGNQLMQIAGGKICTRFLGKTALNNTQKAVDAGLTDIQDGQWHEIDFLLTPGATSGARNTILFIDGILIYDSTENPVSDVESNTGTYNAALSTLSIAYSYLSGSGEQYFELDYFRVGDGTLVNPINANNYFGKYAGTYVSVEYDSTDDLVSTNPINGASYTVQDGVLKLSTSTKATATTVYTAPSAKWDAITIDMTKPFTYSYRFRMPNVTGAYAQLIANTTDNNKNLSMMTLAGVVCFPLTGVAPLNQLNNHAELPANGIVSNVRDNQWHAIDVLVIPKAEGGFTAQAYMDGALIMDSSLTDPVNAAWATQLATFSFLPSPTTFAPRLVTESSFTGTTEFSLEIDYFRIGDGTLLADLHECEASREGPFGGMIITDEGHWYNCVDPDCDERVDFVAHVEGVPCDDLETGCGWGVEASTDSYTVSLDPNTLSVNFGGQVGVNVVLEGGLDETYAAGEVILTYDTSALTFDAAASKLGGATVAVTDTGLKIEEYGAPKQTGGTIYALVFTAAKAGTYTVKIESAGFSDLESASTSDLWIATLENSMLTVTVAEANHNVTLPEIFTGATTVTNGNAYTFTATDNKNYTYGDVTATMGGEPATVVNNGDGTYTIANVTGALVITGTRTANSYKVTIDGEAAADATYGVDYEFTLPENVAVNGATPGTNYSVGSITIGGTAYTAYAVNGREVTIPGAAITGDIVIVIAETAVQPTTYSVQVNYSAGVVEELEYEKTAIAGVDYSFLLIGKGGYDITVTATAGGKDITVTAGRGGEWYIAAADVTGDIVITVTATLQVDGVHVYEYLTLNGGKTMYLVTVEDFVLDESMSRYTYDGNAMYLYDLGNGEDGYYLGRYFVYLVIADSLTADEAKALIDVELVAPETLTATADVNGTQNVDANDAQLVYNMYNGDYADFTENVTMVKFLLADVNADHVVNVSDATAIVDAVLAK